MMLVRRSRLLIFLVLGAALLLAAPAPGATGFGGMARKGLKNAAQALGLAKAADKRSKSAMSRADEALNLAEANRGTAGPAGPQGPAGLGGVAGPAGLQGPAGAK